MPVFACSTLRQFGQTRLASEEDTAVRVRHCEYYRGLPRCLAQAGLDIAGRLQHYWFACGLIPKGYLWLRRALDVDTEVTAARVTALTAGSKHRKQGACSPSGTPTARACWISSFRLPRSRCRLRARTASSAAVQMGYGHGVSQVGHRPSWAAWAPRAIAHGRR